MQRSTRPEADGLRRIAILSGEPGIGKTSLSAAFARDAHELGAVVLYGRCDEDRSISYQPWIDALGHLCRPRPDRPAARARRGARR